MRRTGADARRPLLAVRDIVAWRGKRLSFPCPGDHPTLWTAPDLHVDVDGHRLNGEGIDVHLPELESPAEKRPMDGRRKAALGVDL